MKKLIAFLLFLAIPAFAQSTAEKTTPGFLTTTSCPSGSTVCFKPYSSTNPLSVSVIGTSGATLGYAYTSNGPGVAATFQPAANNGVTSLTGDGSLISNSVSTGAVTLTLGSAVANSIWGNNTSGSAAPAYHNTLVLGGVASVGTSSAGSSMLNVYGSASIGTSYTGTAAPANGLIVAGSAGIGTSAIRNVSTLDVNGLINVGVLSAATSNPMCLSGSTAGTIASCSAGIGSAGTGQAFLQGSSGTPTCGTGCASLGTSPTDAGGTMTSGTLATSVVLNFSTTLSYTPKCVVSQSATTATLGCSSSTSALTCSLSTGLTGDIITWSCVK